MTAREKPQSEKTETRIEYVAQHLPKYSLLPVHTSHAAKARPIETRSSSMQKSHSVREFEMRKLISSACSGPKYLSGIVFNQIAKTVAR